jgi:hypothetical protein
VNGIEVGTHNHGVFDVAEALKGYGAENEIVLRIVGKWHLMKSAAVPTAATWTGKMPDGLDQRRGPGAGRPCNRLRGRQ